MRVKICGVRRIEDVQAIVTAGADAIGFNFYPHSKRHITQTSAIELIQHVPKSVAKVGVFVNASAAAMIQTFDRATLDIVQLHGDESPELIQQLEGRPVIRAFRFGNAGWTPIEGYLARCNQLGIHLNSILIDSFSSGDYGGTGHTADWHALAGWRSRTDVPLLLAGGLTPENVAEAIRIVRPTGVDTASGVETQPGEKDARLADEFVRAAYAALKFAE